MHPNIDLKKIEKHLHPIEFEKFNAFNEAYSGIDPNSESYLANLEKAMRLGNEFLDCLPSTTDGVKPFILRDAGIMRYNLEKSYAQTLPPGEEKMQAEIKSSSMKEILLSLYGIDLQD
jgi:hypothetical protein